METQIIKETQEKYWANKKLTITNQTILNEYIKNGYNIKVKQEIGWFNDEPNNIMLYRTYINIYKNGEHIKRRLFYTDNGLRWEEFVNEIIKY